MAEDKVLISPSILSADFARLGDEIQDVEKAGCDWIHVDVMDGHFVPNLTLGPPVIKWARKISAIPFDVHLMIDEPARYVEDFRKAGADLITFHVEAKGEVQQTIDLIKTGGAKAGMSVRPGTKIESLEPFLDQLDLILIMTVEPGFGGQSFMPDMLEKVKILRQKGFQKRVSVDGGINRETAPLAIEAGADVLVAGTAIFGQKSRRQAIEELRG